ncbi:MAG TPA: PrpF domain-containing protein [Chloroflexota bacterium]|nr:PrpF domain-containing protein [Chloroflexota bacterium]
MAQLSTALADQPLPASQAGRRGDQLKVRCVFMRGGTSRGAYLRAEDLPSDPVERDCLLLAIYGSPDPRQIDGIGGADPLTSKVAIIGPTSRPDADVDYTFGQVQIAEAKVDYRGNCGNISAGVGPFAVDEGLVEPVEPITTVRVHNTNTGKVIVASVPVANGVALACGEAEIAGVPGSGASIMLDFLDSGGSMTGRLLPTGEPRQVLSIPSGPIEASIVDAANPCVFVRARDVGLDGTELPDVFGQPDLLARFEQIRGAAAVELGFCDAPARAAAVTPTVPKMVWIAPPADYVDSRGRSIRADAITLLVRCLSMQRPHKALAVSVAICTGAAAATAGTVVHDAHRPGDPPSRLRLGHPAGVLVADVVVEDGPDGPYLRRGAIERTARRIMDGYVYAPASKVRA